MSAPWGPLARGAGLPAELEIKLDAPTVRGMQWSSCPLPRRPSGSSSRVLQRSKSLPHVVEFTERRIDLVRIAGITGFVLLIVPTASAQVHDEDNGDEAKSNESGNDEVHGWGVLKVPVHKRFPLAAHSWHPPVAPRCRQSFPRASSGCIRPLTTPVTPRLSIDQILRFRVRSEGTS